MAKRKTFRHDGKTWTIGHAYVRVPGTDITGEVIDADRYYICVDFGDGEVYSPRASFYEGIYELVASLNF